MRRSIPFGNVTSERIRLVGVAEGVSESRLGARRTTFRKSAPPYELYPMAQIFPRSNFNLRGRCASLAHETQPRRHPHSPPIAHLDCRRSCRRAVWTKDHIERPGRLAGGWGGHVGCREAACSGARELQPDVAVLDINMPGSERAGRAERPDPKGAASGDARRYIEAALFDGVDAGDSTGRR